MHSVIALSRENRVFASRRPLGFEYAILECMDLSFCQNVNAVRHTAKKGGTCPFRPWPHGTSSAFPRPEGEGRDGQAWAGATAATPGGRERASPRPFPRRHPCRRDGEFPCGVGEGRARLAPRRAGRVPAEARGRAFPPPSPRGRPRGACPFRYKKGGHPLRSVPLMARAAPMM